MKKNEKPNRPLIVVVVKAIAGSREVNREQLLKNLGLPFIIDLVKNEVWVVPSADVFSRDLSRAKAVIVHTNVEPVSVGEYFTKSGVFAEGSVLLHYTALSYGVMTEDQKTSWKNIPSAMKVSPSNLQKIK